MSNHISYQDHIHIIAGIRNRVLARPEEIEDRIEQQHKDQRKCKSQNYVQHQYVSEHLVRPFIIFLSQLHGHQR